MGDHRQRIGDRWIAFLDACFEKCLFSRISIWLALSSIFLVSAGLWLRLSLEVEWGLEVPLLKVGTVLPLAGGVLAFRALLEPEPRKRLTIVGLALNGLLAIIWRKSF